MEKTEAVNRLKKAGYQVQFDSSVVTVILEKRMNVTQEIKKLKSFFKEIGYDASFGVKQLIDEEHVQKHVEDVWEEDSKQNVQKESEKNLEIGEQFSLEDFGIN